MNTRSTEPIFATVILGAPGPGDFQAWLDAINADPTDTRATASGFMNSSEYGLGFGRP
jgi:hypothetical protein